MHQQQAAFENIIGKEEIALYEQFLRFTQCFLLNQKIVSLYVNIFDIISLFAAELIESKIGMWGKGLKLITSLVESCSVKLFHTGLYFHQRAVPSLI